jgi:hypothetical protein
MMTMMHDSTFFSVYTQSDDDDDDQAVLACVKTLLLFVL